MQAEDLHGPEEGEIEEREGHGLFSRSPLLWRKSQLNVPDEVLGTHRFARSFLKDHNDPKPVADAIRRFTKVYPYEAGGVGTPIAEFLAGKAPLGPISPPKSCVFHEASGKVMNTIPPNDFSYFEMLNEIVQEEPAGTLDPELMGPIAAIGIVKGRQFAPDARMKNILTEAVALANATSPRCLYMNPRGTELVLLSGLGLVQRALRFRLRVRNANPDDNQGRRQAVPAHRLPATGGAPMVVLRHDRHHAGDGHAPDRHRLAVPLRTLDADKNHFDGSKTYKLTLPPNIPEANFWSLTLYDTMTRSMLDTPQRYPRAGSQTYPTPAAEPNADGSTTIYFAPEQPDTVKRGNWIQTMPGKGWFTILRLYNPLEPFFTKEWRPSEIEVMD